MSLGSSLWRQICIIEACSNQCWPHFKDQQDVFVFAAEGLCIGLLHTVTLVFMSMSASLPLEHKVSKGLWLTGLDLPSQLWTPLWDGRVTVMCVLGNREFLGAALATVARWGQAVPPTWGGLPFPKAVPGCQSPLGNSVCRIASPELQLEPGEGRCLPQPRTC